MAAAAATSNRDSAPPATPVRADHRYWGRPEDDDETERPAYRWGPDKPASDAAGAAAAALAAASLALRAADPEYAAKCLDHSRRLFGFASKVRCVLSGAGQGPRAAAAA